MKKFYASFLKCLLLAFSLIVSISSYSDVTVFYKNVRGWDNVYMYIFSANPYDRGGSNMGVCTKYDCTEGFSMTLVDAANGIYSYTYTGSLSVASIAFTKNKQDNYNGLYNTEASFRSDYNSSKPYFTPAGSLNETKNSTNYYNTGTWAEAPVTFYITASKGAPYKVGDIVRLTANGGTADYHWSMTIDGGATWAGYANITNSINIGVGVATTYKVVDADGKTATYTITPEVELDCDENHMTLLFKDDFGQISKYSTSSSSDQDKGRATNAYTKYTYKAVCSAIKNAGEYAVVANPKWGGCSSQSGADYGDVCACGNSDTGKWWFRTDNHYDHTQGGLDSDGKYGGMLLLNCSDGTSSDNDILYERAATGLCKNTYTKFSIWVANAAVATSLDPIKLKFILWNKAKTVKIAEKLIDGLSYGNGWKEVTAMFNSGDNQEVVVQVVNKAGAGDNGNDVLIDDITFSACTPESYLFSDATTLRGDTVMLCPQNSGSATESLKLTAVVSTTTFANPYYYWQKSDDGETWAASSVREGAGSSYSTYNITSGDCGYYRVIIAKDATDAQAVASGTISGACGLYSITNSVHVSCDYIEVYVKAGDLCKGEDKAEYVVKVVNKLPYAVTDAMLTCQISAAGGYSNSHIENLTPELTSLNNIKRSDIAWDVEFASLPKFKVGEAVQDTVVFAYLATPTTQAAEVNSWFFIAEAKGLTNPNQMSCPDKEKAVSNAGVAESCDEISLTLAASGSPICLNDQETYTITLQNNRAVETADVEIQLTIPSNQEYVSCTGGTYSSSTKRISIGKIEASGSKIVTVVTTGVTAASGDFKAVLANDATSEKSATLVVNPLPAIDSTPITNNTRCLAPFTGAYSLLVSGGSGSGYTYSIDNGVSFGTQYEFTGLQTANVQAKVKDSNGCISEAKNVKVLDDAQMPVVYNVTGSGTYCSAAGGATIKLSGSELDTNYSLYKGSTKIEEKSGTGSALEFTGIQTSGTYTVEAEKLSSACTDAMDGEAVVTVLTSPTITQNSASGTENQTLCAGSTMSQFTFTLGGSATGYSISPALCNGLTVVKLGEGTTYYIGGAPMPGNTTTQTYTYTITTTGQDASCDAASLTLTLQVYPYVSAAHSVTMNNRCAAPYNGTIQVWANPAEPGVGPYWYKDGEGDTWTGPLTATEKYTYTYTTAATEPYGIRHYIKDSNGCTNFQAAHLSVDNATPPTAFNITGGGAYCAGGTGVDITLGGSQTGVKYTLYKDGVATSTVVDGTNASIKFENITEAGVYTIKAFNTTTECSGDMNGSATVTVNEVPTASISGTTAICDGAETDVTISIVDGKAPYSVIYNDGANHSITGITGASTSFGVSPSVTTKYELKSVSDANGCQTLYSNKSATVTVNPLPTITVKTAAACAPDLLSYSVVVTVSEGTVTCDKSATISNTGNDWTISSVAAGENIVLTVTTVNGCTNTLSVTAPDCSCPTIDAPTGATGNEYCAGSAKTELKVDAPATGYEVKWYDAATGGNLVATGNTFTPSAAGTYYAEMVQTVSSCVSSTRSAATLTENPLPTATISGGNIVNCTTPQVALIASTDAANASYAWSTGDGGSSINVSEAGDYTVTVTNTDNGCTKTSDAHHVNKDVAVPTAIISGGNKIDCTTTSVALTASTDAANASYAWSTGDGGSSINVSEAGDYTVTVTNTDNGCSSTSAVHHVDKDVTVPTATITGGNIINCTIPKVTLVANTNVAADKVSYLWSTGSNDSSIEVSEAGDYTVTVTNTETGCSKTSDAFEVKKNVTIPSASISASSEVINCNISSSTITVTTDAAHASYLWNTGANTNAITVNEEGDYEVTITNTDNGCTNDATMHIDKKVVAPTASITGGTKIDCTTTSLELTAVSDSTKVTYVWSTGANTPTITVSEGGDYTVTITSLSNGCSSTSAVHHVDKDVEKPAAPVSLGNKSYCDQTTVPTLEVAAPTLANYQVNWYDANNTLVASGNTYTPSEPSVGATDTYYAEMLNTTTGCVSATKTSVSITRFALPVAVISGADAVCQESALQLTGSGATYFSWMGEAYTTNDKYDVNTTTAGVQTITLIVKDDNGCESVETSKEVTVNEKPVLTYKAIDPLTSEETAAPYVITCNMPTIRFDLEGGASYKWEDDNTSDSRVFNDAGNHSVIAISEFNCKSNPVEIDIDRDTQKPVLAVSSKDATGADNTLLTCDVTELTLKADLTNPDKVSNVTYKWTSVVGTASADNPIVVKNPDAYSVVATADNGCESDVNTVTVTQDIRVPIVKITTTSDTLTCAEGGKTVTLTASADVAGCTFKWNTGAEGAILVTDAEGSYSVVATGTNGCSSVAVDTTVINKTELPILTIEKSAEKVTCNSVTLTAKSDDLGMTYVWSDRIHTAGESLVITEKGTYSVTGTNRYSCVGTASIDMEEDKSVPQLVITPNTGTLTCSEPSLDVEVSETSGLAEVTYLWSNGKTTAKNTFTEKGTYKVTAVNVATACSSEASITVKENKQVPIIDLQALDAVCLPATVDISQAVKPSSKYDEIKYFFDKEGQQEMPSPIVDVDSKQIFYVQGFGLEGSGCIGTISSIEIVLKGNSATPVVKDYDECATTTTKSLKDQVISDKTLLTFYNEPEGGSPRTDVFDASVENSDAVYYVTNTENGKCESERTAINVHIEGTIDFNLIAADTEIFAARDEAELWVEPTKDTEITSYVWKRNGKVIVEDATSYSSMLYNDSQFDVTGSGRCNSVTRSVNITTLWPTLITPQVGKNASFARGLNIVVYNRFNEKVFEGNDGWDGTLNCNLAKKGDIASPGVYYYYIALPDGESHKGTIEVVKF